MSFSDVFAKVVAVIGGAALMVRKMQGVPQVEAWGAAPAIPAAKSQGAIPTLKMPSARGWSEGQLPIAAPGLKVNAFASGLDHPRWIETLPNGDVLVAEFEPDPGQAAQRVSPCDAGDDAPRPCARRQRQPHHAVA